MLPAMHCVAQMARPVSARSATDTAALAVRIHDITATVAVGVALLKGHHAQIDGVSRGDVDQALEAFETALAALRGLAFATRTSETRVRNVAAGLAEDGAHLGIDLDLEVIGDEGWLGDGEAELVRLAGREAIRNVLRHSGSKRCHLTLDLADCPFVLKVRDWGAGIQGGDRGGNGIERIRSLAQRLGARVVLRSLPGMGTEFVLVGRGCPRTHGHTTVEARLSSVVASESVGSRKRVAPVRPIGGSGQQIS